MKRFGKRAVTYGSDMQARQNTWLPCQGMYR